MAAPFQALPMGVYFNPSAEECVRDFLRPWIAGAPPATDRIIIGVDIYSDGPVALLQGRAPGFSRGYEYKWYMLTQCVRFKNRGKARAKRDVATGGCWKVEQRSKGVVERDYGDDDDDPPGGDRRRTNGFYLFLGGGGGTGKGTKKERCVKTPWLMEEFTTTEDEAAAAADGWKGQRIFNVFCKLYVSPRATNDEKREIFGEDGVPVDQRDRAKTVTAALSAEFFYAVAVNFKGYQGQGSAPPRALGHHQGQPAAPVPPRVPGYHQGQGSAPPRALGHHQGQPAAPVLPRVPGHHHGHAVLPHGVPARPHQIQGYLGFQQGQATPRQIQGDPSQYHYHGVAGHPQPQHVLDPYHHFQEAAFYNYTAPSFVPLDPRQGEEIIHVEKRPRLAYGSPSPAPQPQGGADSNMSSWVVQASTSQEQVQGSDTDAEATRVPGHHHGHAVLTRGVPAWPHQMQGSLGFQRGQAPPRQIQGGPSQYHYHGVAGHPQPQHVLDPYHHFQEAAFYNYSAPSFVPLDPRQVEEIIHVEKRPRLAYGSPSPVPQPQSGADSNMSTCVVKASTSQEQVQGSDTNAEAKVFQGDPVLTPSPPQEIPATAAAASPTPTYHVSATAAPELGGDVCKPTAEPMLESDMFMDLPVLTPEPFVPDVSEFLMDDLLQPPFDDEPEPPPGFDEFSLDDFFKDVPGF